MCRAASVCEQDNERNLLLENDEGQGQGLNVNTRPGGQTQSPAFSRASAQSRDSNVSPYAGTTNTSGAGTGSGYGSVGSQADGYEAVGVDTALPDQRGRPERSWLDRLSLTQRRILYAYCDVLVLDNDLNIIYE